jgi:polysaccharide pyruvyl transferase WcaK-like protein
MPRALLVGEFGQREPGADALVEAFASSLPPAWTPVVTATNERPAVAARDVEEIDAGIAAHRVTAVDAIVFAGGSPLLPLGTRQRRVGRVGGVASMSVAAKALGKPVAGVGLGADLLPGALSRTIARCLVRNADLLTLRDEESADALSGAGARAPFRVGADPTWALLDEPVPTAHGREESVGIVLRAPAELPFDEQFLRQTLVSLESDGHRIRVQPWCWADGDSNDDVALAQRVTTGLTNFEILDVPTDVIDARAALNGCSVVLGMRFHALLAAASTGVPFVALSSTPGARGLARRFGQYTLARSAAPGDVANAVLAALGGPPPSAAVVRSEIAGAEESFRLLRLLLDEGRAEEADEITGLPLRPVTWSQ